MKRDLELFKRILLKVEDLPPGRLLSLDSPLDIEGYDEETIAEHVRLLEEAGYIKAHIIPRYGVLEPDAFKITRLLNDGHDFLANAKNPAIWKKAIDFIAGKGGDVSLAVLKGVLTKVAAEYFGLV